MPYVKRVVRAGATIEIKKYFSARYGKRDREVRAERTAESSEKQQQINERNAVEKLTWLLNANFGPGDLHLVLTYRQDERPLAEESEALMQKFLRKARKLYKSSGKDLKYVWVTEFENTAIHHHLVVNSFDLREIEKLWPHGRVLCSVLDEKCEYSQLAAYLIKETRKSFRSGKISGKRWNASKNLTKPKIEKVIVASDSWTNDPKPLKGYYIAKELTELGIDDFGFPYQKYVMIKIPEVRKRGRTL